MTNLREGQNPRAQNPRQEDTSDIVPEAKNRYMSVGRTVFYVLILGLLLVAAVLILYGA